MEFLNQMSKCAHVTNSENNLGIIGFFIQSLKCPVEIRAFFIQCFFNLCEHFNRSGILPGMGQSYRRGQHHIMECLGLQLLFILNQEPVYRTQT